MSTQEESDKEKYEFVEAWVAKGNRIEFLDSDNEEALNLAAIAKARKLNDGLGEKKLLHVTEFQIQIMIAILSEGSDEQPEFQEYDLLIRILDMEGYLGSVNGPINNIIWELNNKCRTQQSLENQGDALEGVH